jgi:hypothetical protein
MPAGLYDMIAEQGASFDRTLTWRDATATPIDLTGYAAKMQVRKSLDASSALLTLSSTAGITLGGAAGTVRLEVAATKLSQIPAGIYYYDLELTSAAGKVTRLLQGKFTVTREITR